MVGWLAYQQDITNSDAHHQYLVLCPINTHYAVSLSLFCPHVRHLDEITVSPSNYGYL